MPYKPKLPGGSSDEAVSIRWLFQEVEKLRLLDSPTASIQRFVDGQRIRVKVGSGAGVSIHQFRFKTQFNQYLSCKYWNAETEEEGDTVLIAKPYLLRNTTRTITQYERSIAITAGEYPYEREIVYSTQTWSEYVWPAYIANDIIYAVKVSEPLGDLGQGEGESVTYIDLNIDGRKWLKELDVCLDNADRKQLIDGSEIYE